MHNQINLKWVVVFSMILFAALSRMLPHTYNFSPLGAMALFGAVHFTNKWQAFIIPITATWLSDLFINNVIYAQYYPEFTWFYEGFYWQYASYLLIGLVGMVVISKVNVPRVLTGLLASSTIFFLVSNFGVWVGSKTYTQDIAGLSLCYAAGLPFIKGTMMGDLVYGTILFGGFAWLEKRFFTTVKA